MKKKRTLAVLWGVATLMGVTGVYMDAGEIQSNSAFSGTSPPNFSLATLRSAVRAFSRLISNSLPFGTKVGSNPFG